MLDENFKEIASNLKFSINLYAVNIFVSHV